MSKFLYLICLFGILSCTPIDKKIAFEAEFQLVDSTVFNTDLLFRGRFTGNISSSNLFYFADPVSAKKIQLFQPNGLLHAEIDLKKILEVGGAIDYLDVVDVDTVLVLTKYSNQLYVLNRSGDIWKELDLTAYLPKNDFYSYEVRAGSESILYQKNSVVLSCNTSLKEYNDSEDALQNMVVHKWRSPYFIKLNNIWSDSIRVESGFALYQYIYPEDSTNLVLDAKEYIVTDSSIVVASLFSDLLFKLDADSLTLRKKKQLSSKHDSFISHPMNIRKWGFEQAFDSSITRTYKTATISGVQYNPYLQHYYVYIVKKQKRPFDPLETKVPFILQVYDKQWNQLLDKEIDVHRYAGVALPTAKGLMIQTRASSGNFKNKKAVFHEYTY